MKMRVDPVLIAVALGMLNPSVFEVDSDDHGEATPPPMISPVAHGPTHGQANAVGSETDRS